MMEYYHAKIRMTNKKIEMLANGQLIKDKNNIPGETYSAESK